MNDRQCVRENAIHAMRNTWRSPVIMRVYAMDVCQRPTRTAITGQRVPAFALRCRMQSTSTGSRGKHDAGRVAKRSTSGLRISPLQEVLSDSQKASTRPAVPSCTITRARLRRPFIPTRAADLLVACGIRQHITALPARPSVCVLSYSFRSQI